MGRSSRIPEILDDRAGETGRRRRELARQSDHLSDGPACHDGGAGEVQSHPYKRADLRRVS